jgi:uncharacterized protein
VGASVRAAAASFHAAGYTVVAADLFADADLQSCATTHRLGHYNDLLSLALPPNLQGWLYTGGIENHAALIATFSERLPLLGNNADVVRAVRNVHLLESLLTQHGFAMPEMRSSPSPKNTHEWLRKSMRSSGGTLITAASDSDSHAADENTYFQRFVPGRVLGTLFVGDVQQAHLLGITEQLLDAPWTNGRAFLYQGSLGPVQLEPTLSESIQQLGNLLVEQFQLRGWFGVDLILDAQQQLWVLEVNPRYPASLELCERSARQSSAPWHVQACRGEKIDTATIAAFRKPPRPLLGKAILYARANGSFSEPLLAEWRERSALTGDLADIPAEAGAFLAGMPLVTIFADGENSSEVRAKLQQRTAALESSLSYDKS